MATKHQVIGLNAMNPHLSAGEIAERLGCSSAYVRATGQRNGLTFPRQIAVAIPYRLQRAAPDLMEALERLADLTPGAANTATARDLHLTVRAIALEALAKARPTPSENAG